MIIDKKVKWLDRKIKLVDSEIDNNSGDTIKYDENNSIPQDWETYDIINRWEFIKENLNDCEICNFI